MHTGVFSASAMPTQSSPRLSDTVWNIEIANEGAIAVNLNIGTPARAGRSLCPPPVFADGHHRSRTSSDSCRRRAQPAPRPYVVKNSYNPALMLRSAGQFLFALRSLLRLIARPEWPVASGATTGTPFQHFDFPSVICSGA